MNEEPGLPVHHPDELLAAFVDGSALPDERRSVESHLADCARCREDIEFARTGRAALVGLPELKEPGIARADLRRLLREAESQEIQPPIPLERRRERGRVWEQVAWTAAVVAVAAGIIGAVVFISNGSTTRTATAPQKAPAEDAVAPTSRALSVLSRGADYTPDTLTALAKSLSSASPIPSAVPAPSMYAAPDFGRSVSGGVAASLDPVAVTSCLREGSGLGSDAVPTYLELATYQATPAYVGAFRSAVGAPHLLVIVVSVDGCQPLFVVSQSL